MWWLIVLLVVIALAIVGAVRLSRRRAALGADPGAGDYTTGKRNRDTLSDPNTGLPGSPGPGG